MARITILLFLVASLAYADVLYRAPGEVDPAVFLGRDGAETMIEFNLPALTREDAFVDGFGPASVIRIPGWGFVGQLGAPDLPAVRSMVLVDNTGDYRLEIVSEETSVLGSFDVAAFQESPSRNGDTPPYRQDEAVYGNSGFFPGEAATLESIQILRDLRVAWVRFNPVRYNPVTGETLITTSVTARIVPTGGQGENELVRAATGITPSYLPFYEEVLGFEPAGQNAVDGCYLVIGSSESIALCQDLIDWKMEKGYEVVYGVVPTIGSTSSAIDAWIENAFNTWPNPPLYILICGNHNVVPTPLSGGMAQDNQYGVIGTATSVPSIHVGRLSNEDTDDLAYQTWKIFNYEYDPYMPAESWFQNAISIGSTDFEDPAHSWEYTEIFMGAGMTVDYYCDEGGMTPTIAAISASINDGRSLISYIGHGSMTAWGTSGFSNSNVAALSNGRMLPWVNSIACQNGAFDDGYCFAEAWMNEGTVESPKGAIGIMAATVNSPVGQTDSLAEYTFRGYFEEDIWHTGDAVDYGKLKVEQFYGFSGASSNNNMHMIFGCPELDIFCTTSPLPALTADHPSAISQGSFTVTVTSGGSPVEGALVGVVQDSVYLDGGLTNASGVATLTIPALPSSTEWATVTATYHNAAPYRGSANPGTGIEGGEGAVGSLYLGSPAPNPFSAATSIQFSVSEPGFASLDVFDMAGRLVDTITSGEVAAGSHEVTWAGDGADGRPLADGIYMIRLRTAAGSSSRTCVLLR